jgi:hypothetical protein
MLTCVDLVIPGDLSGEVRTNAGITIQQRRLPVIGIDDTKLESYVAFKYDFTGTITDRNYLEVNLTSTSKRRRSLYSPSTQYVQQRNGSISTLT